jgi:plastocyanin
MSRRTLGRIGGLLGLLTVPALWLVVVSPVAAGDPCYHGFEMPARSVGSTTEIKVMPCAFGPTVDQVAIGSTVTFFNGPDFTHLITGASQEWGSRDVELAPGAKVSYTFEKAGVYPYACALHRGMSGTIVVGDAATAGGGTTGGAASTDAAGATDDAVAAPGVGGEIAIFVAGGAAGALVAGGVAWLLVRGRPHLPSTTRASRPDAS